MSRSRAAAANKDRAEEMARQPLPNAFAQASHATFAMDGAACSRRSGWADYQKGRDMRLPLAVMHFHCPDCDPVLVRGTTRAICGHVIQPAIVGDGPQRKCPAVQAHRA